jgi:pyruvate/2-oxoglutarate dehydrogenase complex dihydrolipoamide dehydrogenase (E3) component
LRGTTTHDLIVIGGGSAGLTGARFAARLGARVALVEAHRIGGDCTWTGCVPSKALLRAGKAAHEIREAGRFGIDAGDPKVDMARVRAHVMGAVHDVYDEEKPEALEAEGIDVILAPAHFTDPHAIEAGDRTLSAPKFIVCTGAKPSIPPIPGLAEAPYLTHETIFDNERLPRHLLVIGAGPIGLELALAYRRLGAEVSMLAAEMLPAEDPDVRDFVVGLMAREGVRIELGPINGVETDGPEIVVRCESGEARGDMLLVATGRRPNVESLGLGAAGVDFSPRGGIATDAYLRTNVGHIYAAGDVLGGLQFTHLAGWQCFQAVRNALLPGRDVGNPAALPKVTFLDPEIASVGLTEQEARDQHGADVRVHRWEMSGSDRAVADAQTEGFIKVVARANGKILGAAIVAGRAGEMIAEFVLAMEQGLGLSEISSAVHAYPTWTTSVQQVASAEALDRFLASRLGRLALRVAGLGAHQSRSHE